MLFITNMQNFAQTTFNKRFKHVNEPYQVYLYFSRQYCNIVLKQ